MKPLKKFISSSNRDKFLFLTAAGISLIVKAVIFTIPMRWYVKYLRDPHKMSSKINTNTEIIQSIAKAVNRCSRHAPWKTKCLVDAITAKLILRWYGIPSVLFLGVDKTEGKELIAHAWLKCGDTFITGKRGYQRFTVVSSFA